eukprot:sb/3475368/
MGHPPTLQCGWLTFRLTVIILTVLFLVYMVLIAKHGALLKSITATLFSFLMMLFFLSQPIDLTQAENGANNDNRIAKAFFRLPFILVLIIIYCIAYLEDLMGRNVIVVEEQVEVTENKVAVEAEQNA